MSKKSRRNRANPARPQAPVPSTAQAPQAPRATKSPQTPRANRSIRRNLFIGAAVVLMLAFVIGTLVYKSEKEHSSQEATTMNRAALASGHSPMLGDPGAKVHVVEFLDPACETCAVFSGHVKKLIAAEPDRIRLSVRHVPFHKGSETVVRILEAARGQGRYWQALEALFDRQDQWVTNHVVQADRVWQALGGAGLDLDRIRGEMNAPEISERIAKDTADARALGVTKTPEFFVNGRPMPSFGLKELQTLVREELRRAYP